MEFDVSEFANQTKEAWVTRLVPIQADGVTAQIVEMRKGADKVLVDAKSFIDNWRKQPEAIRGVASVQDPDSFVNLVNRHKSEDSALFADALSDQPSLLAVIDYHKVDHTPQFGRHRIGYRFPLSKDWKFWTSIDGKGMTQADFASVLEDRVIDLVSPGDDDKKVAEDMGVTVGLPIQIMSLSRGLQVNVSSIVKEAITLQSGEGSITFEESHNGADGKPLKIPGAFVISIPVFNGAAATRILVRLRYRKTGPALMWTLQMYRPDIILKNMVDQIALLAAEDTSLPLYFGAPEA